MTHSPATLVLRNARIYTQDQSRPWAEALAIDGERIVWAGNEDHVQEWLSAGTREIDLGGKLVLPGLIDSHFHLLQGAKTLAGVSLDSATSIDDVQQRVREFAEAHPDHEWISGSGWQHELFAAQPIHRALLDAIVPDRPVFLSSSDYHTSWVNTAALERAGLINTTPPQFDFGAVVVGADGVATGELRESKAQDLVRNLIPALANDARDALLRQALQMCASYGITSVHNMDGNADTLQVFRDFEARGEMTVRVRVPLSVSPGMAEEAIGNWQVASDNSSLSTPHTPFVRKGGVKLFADGIVESKTAWMIEPYADGSDDHGAPNFCSEDFGRLILKADALKLQVIVHAIGDMAVRATLDAYHQARLYNGARDSRHRIEHIEVLNPTDLTRFGRMHVTASMQPLHADLGSDLNGSWRKLVGPQRWGWAFPWSSFKLANVPLAFGSDWPVVTMNPFEGMRAGLSRSKLGGDKSGSAFTSHRLSLPELVDGYTTDGAYAEFQENEKGQLRPGMLADVAVLDQNLFDLSKAELPAHIGKTRSVLTVVGGKIVHEAL